MKRLDVVMDELEALKFPGEILAAFPALTHVSVALPSGYEHLHLSNVDWQKVPQTVSDATFLFGNAAHLAVDLKHASIRSLTLQVAKEAPKEDEENEDEDYDPYAEVEETPIKAPGTPNVEKLIFKTIPPPPFDEFENAIEKVDIASLPASLTELRGLSVSLPINEFGKLPRNMKHLSTVTVLSPESGDGVVNDQTVGLPPKLESLQVVQDLSDAVGQIASVLPSSVTSFDIDAYGDISEHFNSLPSGLKRLRIVNAEISAEIAAKLPSGLTDLTVSSNIPNATLALLPRTLTRLRVSLDAEMNEADANTLPKGLVNFQLSSECTELTCAGLASLPSGLKKIELMSSDIEVEGWKEKGENDSGNLVPYTLDNLYASTFSIMLLDNASFSKLTTLSVNMFLEDLPISSAALCPHLPRTLQRLSVSNLAVLLGNHPADDWPQSLTELTVMSLRNGHNAWISELPPNLRKLDIRTTEFDRSNMVITADCFAGLPKSLTSLTLADLIFNARSPVAMLPQLSYLNIQGAQGFKAQHVSALPRTLQFFRGPTINGLNSDDLPPHIVRVSLYFPRPTEVRDLRAIVKQKKDSTQ